MTPANHIVLEPGEQALFETIVWDLDALARLDSLRHARQLEMMGRLAELLVRRQAIPPARLRYFTDPEMLIGGRGKSLKHLFERHGLQEADIFRHPHFLPILRYFICGPDLPADTIIRYRQAIRDRSSYPLQFRRRLRRLIYHEMQMHRIPRIHAAREFFKLTQELGFPRLARWIRGEALAYRGSS